MKVSRVSMAIPCLLALALVIPSHAQDSPQDYLNAHNAARADVGVGPMSWNHTVAAYAWNYLSRHIDDCEMVRSGGPYGENLAWSSASLSGTDAVELWVNEKFDYDYNSNSCAAGKVCEHYTQVVWRNSVRLGCAKVSCNNGGTLISCNYDPPANSVLRCTIVSMALAFLLALALVIASHVQDSLQDYLDAHNAARATVNVGPISWDDTVAGYAQNYLSQHIGDCKMVHSSGPYGENLAWSSAGLSGTDAVAMWVNEKSDYDYNSNTCAPGKQCGHYTQVVWRDSVRLGCAKVSCNTGGTLISCNYDPPGNYVGQKPY